MNYYFDGEKISSKKLATGIKINRDQYAEILNAKLNGLNAVLADEQIIIKPFEIVKQEEEVQEEAQEEVQPTAEELRISELQLLLSSSDYKVLPDYDKPNEEIKIQRQKWREEIRELNK